MKIYRNKNAKEGELYEVEVYKDRQHGKTFYSAEATYIKHSVCPNGDVCRLAGRGYVFDTYNKTEIVNHFLNLKP